MKEAFLFSNLLFLIVVLLLAGSTPDLLLESETFTNFEAFSWGIGIFFLVLSLIFLQNHFLSRRLHVSRLLLIAQIELTLGILIINLIVGAPRVLRELPGVGSWELTPALFTLGLYFTGLACFYQSIYRHLQKNLKRQYGTSTAWEYTKLELRFLLPFIIPFLLFTFAFDLFENLPSEPASLALLSGLSPEGQEFVYLLCSLTFLLIMICFLPLAIVRLWKCQPLQPSETLDRLQRLCEKASFRHGGIMEWNVMAHAVTAAIVGVLPRLRYVMFTPKILESFDDEILEAVLAHEIGHSYHRHLLIYPLIVLGAALLGGVGSFYYIPWVEATFSPEAVGTWVALFRPIFYFLPFALFILIYFRLVFGFFSRLFERQADLHIFALDLPARQMIRALDEIAVVSGNIHNHPNWHHHSIADRIEFLEKADANRSLIVAHHLKAKLYLWGYLLVLLSVFLLIFY